MLLQGNQDHGCQSGSWFGSSALEKTVENSRQGDRGAMLRKKPILHHLLDQPATSILNQPYQETALVVCVGKIFLRYVWLETILTMWGKERFKQTCWRKKMRMRETKIWNGRSRLIRSRKHVSRELVWAVYIQCLLSPKSVQVHFDFDFSWLQVQFSSS